MKIPFSTTPLSFSTTLLLLGVLATPFAALGVEEEGAAFDLADLPGPPADLELLDPPVRGQYRERVDTLSELLASHSDSTALASAVGALGQWYDAYEYRARAARCYEKAAKLAVGEDRWSYHLGHLHYQRGDLENAREAFHQAALRRATRSSTWVWLSRVAADQGRTADALAHAQKARELDSDSSVAAVQLARVLVGIDEYEAARDVLVKLLGHPEAGSTVHHLLGMSYRGLGDLDLARSHLRQAREKSSPSPRAQDPVLRPVEELIDGSKARTKRGEWLFARGRHHEAVLELARAREANPRDPSIWVNHATALLGAGRVDEAKASLEALVSDHPRFAGGHAALGAVLTVLDERQAAKTSLSHALELDGRSIEALDGLATLDILAADYESAATRYRRIVALDPTNARAHYRGLLCALLSKRSREALGLARMAMQVVPESQPLRLLAARCLACLDETGTGMERARELARAQSPDPLFTLESRAMLAAASGDVDEAVALQQRVVERAGEAARERAVRRLEHYRAGQRCLTVFEVGEFAL